MNKIVDNALHAFIQERGSNCLLLARHGETHWNAIGRLQGQQDTSLNDKGEGQAFRAAQLLKNIPIKQIHASTLQRSLHTAQPIADVNINRPDVICSDLLKETALGILEGEMKDRQSTPVLSRHYQKFSQDEINYRIPDGENLHDVFTRVEDFFTLQNQLIEQTGIHLIVGHRNVNKMIIKYLLNLSFEDGFQVEHEHQRLYLYLVEQKEIWTYWHGDTETHFTHGYATINSGSSYA